jgi:penicillin-binding protein 1C
MKLAVRLTRARFAALACIAVLLVLPRVLPKPALQDAFPSSRSVVAANGELLRLTLASDQQYRLWTPLADIAPALQEAVLLYEDRWFYRHPGINPWALARASVATVAGGRRIGGSTITMQLARRLHGIDSRSVAGKLQQAFAALWLELRYSKRDILEAYLNAAPFGGNVEGVGAASLTYWRKSVQALSVPEAINLAVIPQNPRKRVGGAGQAARTRLAALWLAEHPGDGRFTSEAVLAVPFRQRSSLPFAAPHAVDYLLRSSGERVVRSTLEPRLQGLLERVLGEYVKSRKGDGIVNASALLVDTATMQVKALIGSADYRSVDIAGQVNGVFARRSPGSTLKPFIYAQALDQGLIHSASILRDAPSNFGAFAPENFDGRFSGPLPAHQALIKSRNVPAVDLAARLQQPGLYDFLKLAGVQKLEAESHYGLALSLGGAELTMEELAQLYAILPNEGRWQPLRFARDEPQAKPLVLLSPEAAFITLDMLRQTPRPDTFAPAGPAVAWKTGTSWGFRDAWTAGVFGRHVLVVWVGNFDGASNPAFIGIDAAAPLFLRIVDAVRADKLDPGPMISVQPERLRRVEVCAASGDLPNAECPVTAPAWFIAGTSPIRTSTLHRKVLVDTRSGRLACAPGPHTRAEVFEYWPSDMRQLFNRAGMPLRAPPAGDCGEGVVQDAGPQIVAPLRGLTHLQRTGRREPLLLRADAGSGSGKLLWFAGDALVGTARPGETLQWLAPRAGRYMLRVVDEHGLADSREVLIEAVE